MSVLLVSNSRSRELDALCPLLVYQAQTAMMMIVAPSGSEVNGTDCDAFGPIDVDKKWQQVGRNIVFTTKEPEDGEGK